MKFMDRIVWVVCNDEDYDGVHASREDAREALREHEEEAKNCDFLPRYTRIERCRIKYELRGGRK